MFLAIRVIGKSTSPQGKRPGLSLWLRDTLTAPPTPAPWPWPFPPEMKWPLGPFPLWNLLLLCCAGPARWGGTCRPKAVWFQVIWGPVLRSREAFFPHVIPVLLIFKPWDNFWEGISSMIASPPLPSARCSLHFRCPGQMSPKIRVAPRSPRETWKVPNRAAVKWNSRVVFQVSGTLCGLSERELLASGVQR